MEATLIDCSYRLHPDTCRQADGRVWWASKVTRWAGGDLYLRLETTGDHPQLECFTRGGEWHIMIGNGWAKQVDPAVLQFLNDIQRIVPGGPA